MKKPDITKFSKQTWATQLLNRDAGKEKWVSVDWKEYAKALEKYCIYIEKRPNPRKAAEDAR